MLVAIILKLGIDTCLGSVVVGHRFHFQNRLSEGQTDSIIEVTSVLGVSSYSGNENTLSRFIVWIA